MRIITSSLKHLTDATLHTDFNVPYVFDVIKSYAQRHARRLDGYCNNAIEQLLNTFYDVQRLKYSKPRRLLRHWMFFSLNSMQSKILNKLFARL